jgi:hypothetical protein
MMYLSTYPMIYIFTLWCIMHMYLSYDIDMYLSYDVSIYLCRWCTYSSYDASCICSYLMIHTCICIYFRIYMCIYLMTYVHMYSSHDAPHNYIAKPYNDEEISQHSYITQYTVRFSRLVFCHNADISQHTYMTHTYRWDTWHIYMTQSYIWKTLDTHTWHNRTVETQVGAHEEDQDWMKAASTQHNPESKSSVWQFELLQTKNLVDIMILILHNAVSPKWEKWLRPTIWLLIIRIFEILTHCERGMGNAELRGFFCSNPYVQAE